MGLLDWFRRPPDPPEPPPLPPTMEERVRGLLEEYSARVTEDADRSTATGAWIFRSGVSHADYVRTIVGMLSEAHVRGFTAGVVEGTRDWSCVCRCLKHAKHGCPRCLNVYGCPVHAEVAPEALRVEVLNDPEQLARELFETTHVLKGKLVRWEDVNEDIRLAMIESARRVVCLRAQQR
jgi:hypothetical protein